MQTTSAIVHTVQAGLGANSVTHTLGTGEAKVQEIILDETFVASVRAAVTDLGLSGIGYYDYVAHVAVKLLITLGEKATLADVRHALDYLAEAGEIVLPELAAV